MQTGGAFWRYAVREIFIQLLVHLLICSLYSSLADETLVALMAAMQEVGYNTKESGSPEETTPYNPVTVLFLEFIVSIAIRNGDRIQLLW